ncbi:MAG: hypothetical protein LBC64_00130 [Fibromonadaceae bacterium]|jgi:hypothetical protein|nr:hypothetical protein [Fibromonadaceae bacterium]
MPCDSNFKIEFPANKGYIPFVQEFLRDYLKSFDFSKELAESVAEESYEWFNSVTSDEKFLHAVPTISFTCKTTGYIISVQIVTTDKKEFITSLNLQNSGGKK